MQNKTSKSYSKRDVKLFIFHNLLVLIGTILYGFGTAIFLTKNTIVAGGLAGIGFIIQYNLQGIMPEGSMIIDIIVWICSITLWLISFFVLGKDFAFKTLLATIVYPLSLTLFYRVDFFQMIADQVSHSLVNGEWITTTGDLLLCALFGGLVNGFGLSLTFLGKGSTGGVDVIAFIVEKYLNIRVALVEVILDAIVIITGIFALNFPHMIVNCLVGIIASFVQMIMVDLVYTKQQNAFALDIVSTKWEEITSYIINDMERGVSLIEIEGAYTSQKRKMIRTVLSKSEYVEIKEYLSKVDPEAFCTFTDTNAVFGEGFKTNQIHTHSKIIKKIIGKDKQVIKVEENKDNNKK